MMVLIVSLLAAVSFLPLLVAYRQKAKGKNPKKAVVINIISVFMLCILTTAFGIVATANSANASEEVMEATATSQNANGMGYLAMALSTGIACIGGGIAVSSSASAAIGAISENESVFGKALIFVALAEGIAIYGMLVSILIMLRLT